MTESTRAYFYRVAVAAIPVLTVYGVATEEVGAVWLGLIGAVLSTGLAVANTSTKDPS